MRNISIAFAGFNALQDVDFTLQGGSIHALVGANGAGKSTLMAILSGAHDHYRGEILIDGQPVAIHSPLQARRHGIHVVQQEVDVALIPTLSVAENIMLDWLNEPGHWLNWAELHRRAAQLLQQWALPLNPRRRLADCTLAEKQQVLLARALSHRCRFLVLDEPTAPLDRAESERLFNVVRRLQSEGIGIVFISHRIHELSDICDRLTVLRDGRRVSEDAMRGLSGEQIVEKMLGHRLDDIFPSPRPPHPERTLLQVQGLHDRHKLRDVSLRLHEGEILGIAGLVGAKRTDIVETLFGIREKVAGTIKLHGKAIDNHSANEAINHGFALVTEERRSTGIYAYLDVGFNSLISNIRNYKNKLGLLDNARMKSDTQWVIDAMRVKTPGHHTHIGSLSGGNQQKVIIGRWLLTQPEILMLDEPTRGIDVGAKFEIYQLMTELAKKGKGIIIVSSEMPELLGITDRILVMSNGQVAGIVNTKQTSQNEILRLASLHL
ncbi:ATP-binding cassette domain-containing protein [Serratia marcescens]|nr:ATP-binding cassette domain-containing protein [Serratia marcescens]RTG30513.1 ATP-binding cassette domain-containing protein [Serratia marcescens]RTG70018.1 ATP-binding cassette domain-containing protein [Serratia marcescens]